MVYVLGIHWTGLINSVHEGAVTLVKDGRMVAAISEDRLTKVKHDSAIPINSIKEVLRIAQIDGSKIDAVAVPWDSPEKEYIRNLTPLTAPSGTKWYPNRIIKYPFDYTIKKRYLKIVLEIFGINCPIHFVDHHVAHAASAYYTSGFDDCTVITLDGASEKDSAGVWKTEDFEMKQLGSSAISGSLGFFYGQATEAAGFKANDGEGKSMGLACYGNPNAIYNEIKDFIRVKGLKIEGEFDFVPLIDVDVNDQKMYAHYRYVKWKNNKFSRFTDTTKAEDICASAQKVLEEKAAEYVKNAVDATGLSNVAIAGGVALNVKMNKKIRELANVDSVFIHPNPGDQGTPTGAAIEVCKKLMADQGKTLKPWKMEHAYYGSAYTNEEIEKAINEYHLEYEKVSNPSKVAGDLVSQGKVIGWFQGNMEYGPRALGNRSVVADPRDPKMRDKINKFLKKRDWFMPFAPSMLDKAADEFVEDATEAPYMIMAFDCKKGVDNRIPAASHVDNTLRPQTVSKTANPRYYELIQQMEKNTGVPVVLNTSFNRHGKVIVRTPDDALDHLVWKCVDNLVIGDYLVHRKLA